MILDVGDSHMIPFGNLAHGFLPPAAGKDESGGCHQLHPCSSRDEFLDAKSLRTGRSDGDPMVRFMGVSWCFVEAQNYAVFVEGVVLSSF
jgi:hypothetical protein